MVWTTPRTWVAGEIVGAGNLNLHVRDNLLALRAFPQRGTGTITVSGTTLGSFGTLAVSLDTTIFAGGTPSVVVATLGGGAAEFCTVATTARAANSFTLIASVVRAGPSATTFRVDWAAWP